MEKHIYFIIRYSAYTKARGAWQIGKNVTAAEYKASLFSESRLNLHQELFFGVTLPTLKAIAATVSATALVFISDELPSVYKDALLKASEKFSWLKIVRARSDKGLVSQIDKAVESKIKEFADDVCYATVRLDDDDALAPDFGIELNKYLKPEFSGMGVTFSKGVFAIYDQGVYSAFYHYKKMNNAQGLAFVGTRSQSLQRNIPMTVFGTGNHTSIDERFPTVNDSSKIMFLRSEHDGSDLIASGRLRDKSKMKSLSDLESQELKQRFNMIRCF
ncbi:glycosyltransferase [Salinicola halophyticus]|uniref:glycosyltransferase n=1 Tax=Salinicola halophyticus TaxID=1808881 RepID=UPI003F457C3F